MTGAEVFLEIIMDVIRSIYHGMPPATEEFLVAVLGGVFGFFGAFGVVFRALWDFLLAFFQVLQEIIAVFGETAV